MSFDPVAMEYYPTIFFNEFWLLKDYLIPMNETVTEVPLFFTLTSMTQWKFSLFSQMDTAFGKQVCHTSQQHIPSVSTTLSQQAEVCCMHRPNPASHLQTSNTGAPMHVSSQFVLASQAVDLADDKLGDSGSQLLHSSCNLMHGSQPVRMLQT